MLIKPFRNLGPNKLYLDEFVAMPYDTLSLEDVVDITSKHPHSVLKITRPDALTDNLSSSKDELERARKEKIITKSDTEQLFVYELKTKNHTQTSIVCCVSCEEYLNNTIFTHEETKMDKVHERLQLMEITNTQTEPVILTYEDKILDDIFSVIKKNEPDLYTCLEEVEHRVWAIDDICLIDEIEKRFKTVKRCYIADGHHRSKASSLLYQKQLEEGKNTDLSMWYIASLFQIDELEVFEYKTKDGKPCAGELLDTRQALGIYGPHSNKKAKSTWFWPKLASGLFMREI